MFKTNKLWATLLTLAGIGFTTQAWAVTASKYAIADKQLNSAYQALATKMTPQQKQQLIVAEKAWMKFRDEQAACEAMANGDRRSAILRMTEARTKELRQMLTNLGKSTEATCSMDFTGKYSGNGVHLTLRQTGWMAKGMFSASGFSGGRVVTANFIGHITSQKVLVFDWEDSWGNTGSSTFKQLGNAWQLASKVKHRAPNAQACLDGLSRLEKKASKVTPQDFSSNP